MSIESEIFSNHLTDRDKLLKYGFLPEGHCCLMGEMIGCPSGQLLAKHHSSCKQIMYKSSSLCQISKIHLGQEQVVVYQVRTVTYFHEEIL